jgi:tRNA pseudouridine55 synthase
MIQSDGILLVDKESGPSSFRVAEKVKGIIKAKKTGHAGTLDPFATGLLIVLVNQGTKLSPFLMSQDKVYKAALKLGVETDTHDLTGRIVEEKDADDLTGETIKQVALQFVGTITQVPPQFSALHHQGKRAYELAREGIAVDLQEREVRVDYIDVLSVDLPTVWIEVGCGSGTYIRTLAADIGRALGTGAHLTSLRRLRSGPFSVDNALTVNQIAGRLAQGAVNGAIIPLTDALKGMVEVQVTDQLARKVRVGYKPHREELFGKDYSFLHSGDLCKVIAGDGLVAVLKGSRSGYDIVRVFV